ncbi:MAG: glycosyltransferase family 2 protein [Chlamydiales bacterium]|nr:glycosyltransferase family 2 protein [Chlamydiales bacterium]
MMSETVGVAVITHCSKHHLQRCLPQLLQSPLKPRVLVVNSSSNDGTVEEAERLGAETLVVPRASFNHGSTRERARKFLGTDIVVMITPDAYAIDTSMLTNLLEPILSKKASLAYAKQIPREGAGFLEGFLRDFNYPEISHIRGIEDVAKWGVYSFFCSNSCAAYRNSALDEVGGFPSVLTAEDAFTAANLLRKGHKIAYVAEAVVKHSHDYTLFQELRRHFDTGYVRKQHAHLLNFGSTDQQRGRQYFVELNKRLAKQQPMLLPYAWAHTAAKFLGYALGRLGPRMPLALAKRLSSQDFYWNSDDFHRQRMEKS